jgi:hypothetical protein
MIYRALFTLWAAVCTAVPALAAELEFSAGGEAEYDDNVFRSEEDKDDDILLRLRPGVRLYEDRGDDLNFSAAYQAPIEFSVDNSDELDDVDHIGIGRFNYHVDDQIEFFGNERYGYLRSTLRNLREVDDTTDFLDINDERDRVTVNDASLGGLYKFSPRTVARAIVNTSFFDSTREDRARVWSVGGTGDVNYSLTMKHQVGAGLAYNYQDFDEREDIPGSQTNTYRVYGSWRWLIDPTLSFDLQAGPAYLETEQDDADRFRTVPLVPFSVLPNATVPAGFLDSTGTPQPASNVPAGSLLLPQAQNCPLIDGSRVSAGCAGNVVLNAATDGALIANVLNGTVNVTNIDAQGEGDETITGFVQAVLTKQWLPNFHSAVSYSREQGDASGLGGTVIVDAVSLSNTWDFHERWSVALRGDYVRRESAFDLAQTFDQVVNSPVPGGTVLVATRTGTAFNSTRDVDIDTDRYGAALRITHMMFRSTSLYGQVRYDRQESNGNSLGSGSDFENILATFGVRHVFEPISLW